MVAGVEGGGGGTPARHLTSPGEPGWKGSPAHGRAAGGRSRSGRGKSASPWTEPHIRATSVKNTVLSQL